MSRKSFFIFCLSFLSTSFGVATLAPLVPQMAGYFNVDAMRMAHVSWFYMLPYGVFALVWAPLTRIVTIKNIFIVTCLGFSISTLFFSLAQTVQQAFFAQTFVGIFSCSFMPIALIVIGKTVEPKEKGKHIGILFGLAYISSFIGVVLSGFLFWKTVYLVPAIISFITFISALFYLEDFDFRKVGFKISYFETCGNKQALFLFVIIFLASFFYHSIQQLLGVYLSKTYSLKQVILSSIFTVATICSIIFQFAGGLLAKRVDNIKIARAGFFLMSIFAALLLINKSYRAMFFLMVLWGTGWALSHIGLSSYLTHLPDKILRDAASLNSSIRFISGGLGVISANSIIACFGFPAHFIAVALAMVVLGVFVNRLKGGKYEQS